MYLFFLFIYPSVYVFVFVFVYYIRFKAMKKGGFVLGLSACYLD